MVFKKLIYYLVLKNENKRNYKHKKEICFNIIDLSYFFMVNMERSSLLTFLSSYIKFKFRRKPIKLGEHPHLLRDGLIHYH